MITEFTVPAGHPVFAGHFPGRPIVPGVMLIDRALQAIAERPGFSAGQCTLLSVKFKKVVHPDELLTLHIEAAANGNIRFEIAAAGEAVATGMIAPTAAVAAPMISSLPQTRSPEPSRPEWITRRERGTLAAFRIVTWLSLRLGRRVSRTLLYAIAAYFLLFAPASRRPVREYLRRALQREPTVRDHYRLLMNFASTIHDRVYLINGQYDLFQISVQGGDVVKDFPHRGKGAFLLGAHVGSFEVIHAMGQRQPGLSVAMAMYEANARKLNAVLAAVNPRHKPEIIALGTLDSMLRIQARLDAGTFVGVLGDRTLGAEPFQHVIFLGAPACFPVSAMRAAATLRQTVVFMLGLYRGGNRYHLVFDELADFSMVSAEERDSAVEEAIVRYAALLESHCRSDPYNWFNFFDFWRDLTPRPD